MFYFAEIMYPVMHRTVSRFFAVYCKKCFRISHVFLFLVGEQTSRRTDKDLSLASYMKLVARMLVTCLLVTGLFVACLLVYLLLVCYKLIIPLHVSNLLTQLPDLLFLEDTLVFDRHNLDEVLDITSPVVKHLARKLRAGVKVMLTYQLV